ncbi:MAG: hypothetical protein QOE38_2278 [Thermoleophilaceae bacterium]|nr:hypothetical protein [Thermoleophilaceae bacterium]
MFANLRAVTESSLASAREVPEPLDEERVRDQLGAAEELHYLGHAEPAFVAVGAALAGVLRLRAGFLLDHSASCGALLEELRATGAVSVTEHEILCRLVRAHERLTRGYAPDRDAALSRPETGSALATIAQMLESLPSGSRHQVNGRPSPR